MLKITMPILQMTSIHHMFLNTEPPKWHLLKLTLISSEMWTACFFKEKEAVKSYVCKLQVQFQDIVTNSIFNLNAYVLMLFNTKAIIVGYWLN